MNRGGVTFGRSFLVKLTDSAPPASIHDVFFLDADANGFADIVLVNEDGASQLFYNDGQDPVSMIPGPRFMPGEEHMTTGASGDFNGDGFMDFVLLGFSLDSGVAGAAQQISGYRYLNDPTRPGTFQEHALAFSRPGVIYDVELGDLDLDGDIDLVGAVLQPTPGPVNSDASVVILLNDSSGSFADMTTAGAGSLLPGLRPYQRLSADLLDLDQDGDLDLYLSGADNQNVGFGNGVVANQLWKNQVIQ
jgi:hypothetical protein